MLPTGYAYDRHGRRVLGASFGHLRTSELLLAHDADSCASRAYCAAFYAVSALFAEEGTECRKHTQLNAAVHRDLVNTGRWTAELGRDFRSLIAARDVGDYGTINRVAEAEAANACAAARRIVEQVRADLGLES